MDTVQSIRDELEASIRANGHGLSVDQVMDLCVLVAPAAPPSGPRQLNAAFSRINGHHILTIYATYLYLYGRAIDKKRVTDEELRESQILAEAVKLELMQQMPEDSARRLEKIRRVLSRGKPRDPEEPAPWEIGPTLTN
jgi:hypothetical protein